MIPDRPGLYWYVDSKGKESIARVRTGLHGLLWADLFDDFSRQTYGVAIANRNVFSEWIGTVVDPAQDVIEFHQAMFPHLIATVPAIPANPIAKLRLKLIEEEYREMVAGLDAGDMVEIVDGALDLIYVVLGMLVSYGVNPWPIWQEVQRSNMAKALGPIRDDGKKLKPPGWTPPDVVGELIKQGWDGGQPR